MSDDPVGAAVAERPVAPASSIVTDGAAGSSAFVPEIDTVGGVVPLRETSASAGTTGKGNVFLGNILFLFFAEWRSRWVRIYDSFRAPLSWSRHGFRIRYR
ncbi:hypothetical protein [Prauserella marina]|uniref:hypothetical protein n=1 Tax=Prauserella marina TaxID=530584 RepID=UPI00115FDE53|nr:hypothetical protein [Prauserella marina]